MKRITSLLLALLLLLGAVPMSAQAEETTIEVSGYNRSRDAGNLIVYTDDYGQTTGTNAWGVEAVVNSQNRVTALKPGNSTIPEGGFVVSGHDDDKAGGRKMKSWIYDNISIGDYVYFSRRTLTLTVSKEPLDDTISPFFSFDNPADAVNTPRGEDQMILYTPEYGETTGTNEYGYEVVIENGIVTKLGGNDSAIPENGYVVSLHGSPAGWMRLKIVKGMTVEYDPETLNVVFTYNAEGLKKAVTYSFDYAQTQIDEAKAHFVYADYDAASTQLEALREEYEDVLSTYETEKNDNRFADDCDDLIRRAEVVCNALCDSYTVQYRGVWVRPSQTSAKEVDAYVKKLHDACINFVSVEGWFENGTIMEVPEDSLYTKHKKFNYDVLQAYIDACHKYGMECHLWMPIMDVGSFIDDGYEENTVTGRHPEWLSLNNNGQPYNKDGFMMIDPANDEAKAHLLEFYKYLVTNYDLDAFELDYIRYYTRTGEADFGYTEAAFEGFEEAYGYGVEPRFDPNADYWQDWCAYRRDCVTGWVRDIRAMIDAEAPDVLLAADVAYPFDHALYGVYQDFPRWLEEGLIDIVHPMAYGDGYGDEIRETIALAGNRCMVVTGLGAQTDFLGAKELERQAREDNLYGAYGDCYFEAQTYLSDQVPAAVTETVYRAEAIPPFLDTDASVTALLDYMTARIDNVILPQNGMSDQEASSVKDAVEAAKDTVEGGRIGAEAHKALRQTIDALSNENARQVLGEDLYRAEYIAGVLYGESGPDSGASAGDLTLLWILVGGGAALLAIAVLVVLVLRRRKTADA